MSSYFTLSLDVTPPANPILSVNGGVLSVGSRIVTVSVQSSDYMAGANDVTEMLIWGDVDPTSNPLVQTTEGASSWMSYVPNQTIVLSTGPGPKVLRARIRDDVHNQTSILSVAILYNPLIPVVSITRGVARSKISTVSGYDSVDFTWQSSLDYTSYEVRAVPFASSPRISGVLIPSVSGSVHVSGGSGLAETDVLTTIRGADLAAASPGNALKTIKVFVLSGGIWSQ